MDKCRWCHEEVTEPAEIAAKLHDKCVDKYEAWKRSKRWVDDYRHQRMIDSMDTGVGNPELRDWFAARLEASILNYVKNDNPLIDEHTWKHVRRDNS